MRVQQDPGIETAGERIARWPATSESIRGLKLLPVDLSRQLVPGSFEHALNHLLDDEPDPSGLDQLYGKAELANSML